LVFGLDHLLAMISVGVMQIRATRFEWKLPCRPTPSLPSKAAWTPPRTKIASEITRVHSDVQDAMDGVDAVGACRRAFEIDHPVMDALR
jgi:hypothetical protein